MSIRQNITLSIREETLKKARHVAVDRGVSLSRLLSDYIDAIVEQKDAYDGARRRALDWLERGFPVSECPNDYAWTREELHVRE